MIIKKLEESHTDALFPLFETHKYMGANVDSADFFAKGIESAPQDWHMLQRIWIDGDFQERSA